MRDNLYMERVLDLVKKYYIFRRIIFSNKFHTWHDEFYIFEQVLYMARQVLYFVGSFMYKLSCFI